MKPKNYKLFWRCYKTVIGYGSNFRCGLYFQMEDTLWDLLESDDA